MQTERLGKHDEKQKCNCSPTTVTISVHIPLKSTIYLRKLLLERMKINKKETF